LTASLRSWWQKIKLHPFIVMGIVVALFAIIAFILAVHMFGWDWTGFMGGESKITTTSTPNGTTTAKELQPGKTLWDWLGLLAALAIPLVVGLGAAWFTAQQGKVSDRENTDNQRETTLQGYIDKMSELLLHEKLRISEEEHEVRKIARVRTLTILPRLDANRKRSVLQFLQESGLIEKDNCIIDLTGADLRGAKLIFAGLRGAKLSGTDLRNADLRYANLSEANLHGADLRYAKLDGADLSGTELKDAIDYNLYALNTAKTLKGATMPDGSKHP
jgi:hypothetical protein